MRSDFNQCRRMEVSLCKTCGGGLTEVSMGSVAVSFRAVLDNPRSRSLECLPSIAQILITVTAKEHGSLLGSIVSHTVRRTFGRPYVLPFRPMLPVPRPSITKLVNEVKSTEEQSVCVIVNHA